MVVVLNGDECCGRSDATRAGVGQADDNVLLVFGQGVVEHGHLHGFAHLACGKAQGLGGGGVVHAACGRAPGGAKANRGRSTGAGAGDGEGEEA